MADRQKESLILWDEGLSDMEKLREIFDISKDSLKEYDPYLYYAILAVLDSV